MKQKLEETHQLMREYMNVEQERQKAYYDRSKYAPSYKVGEELLVFNPTVKKRETRKFTRKAIKVHYGRLNKYTTREKLFTPEPQPKRKTANKKQKNRILNSSEDGDIIEIESSTDSESNLNTENQSEAEDANDSLNVTNETSENEAKESEQDFSKGQEKAQNVPEGGGATSSKAAEYTDKKPAETKIPKKFQKKIPEKSNKNLVVKQKVLKKILIVIPRHQ